MHSTGEIASSSTDDSFDGRLHFRRGVGNAKVGIY